MKKIYHFHQWLKVNKQIPLLRGVFLYLNLLNH
nr:MAG TPA: hypothetical protein [Caudoviricetes sp.]